MSTIQYNFIRLFKNKMSITRCITTLVEIPTWEDYYSHNKSSIPRRHAEYPIDREINRKVSIWRGDITLLRVDAIVNAAKASLLGGGGVDGAIHKAAGKKLKKECAKLGGTAVGTAKITSGYDLPVQYVIHAVGPQDQDPNVLNDTYESSLAFVSTHSIRSIAFPSISTGVYRFPADKAAKIATHAVRRFLYDKKREIDRIVFVVFDERDEQNYKNALPIYFPIEASDGPTSSTMLSGAAKPKPTSSSSSRRMSSFTPITSAMPTISGRSFGSQISMPSAITIRKRNIN